MEDKTYTNKEEGTHTPSSLRGEKDNKREEKEFKFSLVFNHHHFKNRLFGVGITNYKSLSKILSHSLFRMRTWEVRYAQHTLRGRNNKM
jgi:hypothetical protein